MTGLYQDLRYAVRMFAKKPGFTAIAVLALALGVGANSAIFSVVNSVVLQPLPYHDPDRLVFLHESSPQMEAFSLSLPNYLDFAAQNEVFESLAAFRRDSFNLTGVDEPERLFGRMVTANLLPTIGVQPALGRGFTPEDDRQGAPPVALISHSLWDRRFARDPKVLGQTVRINGLETTILGVLPEDFRFFYRAEILVPLLARAQKAWFEQRGDHPGMVGIGRIKPGLSVQQADASMDAIAERLEKAYPDSNTNNRVRLTLLGESFVGDFRGTAMVLLGAVGFVLLIACANVANLLLAKAAARTREIAVRTALGAGRARIARQLLTESVLLSLAGGALGLLLAVWGIDALVALAPSSVPRLEEIAVDRRVLAFTLALSFAVGLLFGLAPALHSSRTDIGETLKATGKTPAPSRLRGRSLLVVAEIAMALVLLAGAGLMIRSFLRLQQVDVGFQPQDLLTVQMNLRPDRYSEAQPALEFHRRLLEEVRALPGVRSVALGTGLPLGGSGWESSFWIDGRPDPPPGERPMGNANAVSAGYFETLGMRLVRGRTFGPQDTPQSPRAIVVDANLAAKFFPDSEPLGAKLRIGAPENPPLEIVGVVEHIKYYGLEGDEAVPFQYYMHRDQMPAEQLAGVSRGMNLFVRTEADPMGLAAPVRAVVRAIDPEQPLFNLRAMDELIADAVASRRFNMLSLGLFAAVALALAAVGIYGVMAYAVTQRTHEIGIRMALGAQRLDVLRLVVGQGMRLAGLGLAIGLGLGLLLSRVLAGMVYGVSATDPATYLAVSGVLAMVAFLACYLPARRASRVHPMVALRHE